MFPLQRRIAKEFVVMHNLVLIIIVIVCFFCWVSYTIKSEYKKFNKGICPKCGKRFRLFDIDSHGARGYVCDDCEHYIWISYDSVDKNYRKL